MKKNSTSNSAFFNPRIFAGFLLCCVGAWLAMFSFASTPSSGTIDPTLGATSLSYTAGPFLVANPTPVIQVDDGPQCSGDPSQPCDDFALTVTLPPGYHAAHPYAVIRVTESWTDTGAGQSDYDLDIYKIPRGDCDPDDCTITDGSQAPDYHGGGGSNPEIATIFPLADGTQKYTVVAVPFTPTGESSLTVNIQLIPGVTPTVTPPGPCDSVVFGGADKTCPGNPRYQNFYAPAGSSAEASRGEFNIGFNPFTKRIMAMNAGPVWRLTPGEVQVPAKPECCEALWEDKSAVTLDTPAALDPILWTDQKTGRTFGSNSTAGANFEYAYTDNDGDLWVEAGIAPPNGGSDHETLGSGPYPDILPYNLPLGLGDPMNPVTHGEVVYYCSQVGVGPATCQRSDTFGISYGGGVVAYTGSGAEGCGGLHGHVHVAPDGTAWVPVNQCSGRQGGVTSTDAGVTWTEFVVKKTTADANGPAFTAVSQTNGADPSIGIDSANTAYYCYVNNEVNGTEGHVHVAVSTDGGQTWIRDVDVGATHGIINAAEPEAVGGSAGRAACGFIGTNVSGDFELGTFTGVWYPYIATTYDQGQTWVTVNAAPNDPVQNHTGVWQQGGSGQNGDRNLLDFNEITIDDKGRVLYGYSDGCHSITCIGSDNSAGERGAYMRVARQFGGKPLLTQFDPSPVEPVLPKPPCLAGTRDCTAHLSWKAPDNGGSDIIGYQILRGTTAGNETTVLVNNTGNNKTTYNDTTANPSVAHYFYVVKAITALGTGPQSSEVDLTVAPKAADYAATTQENQSVVIPVLINDCGTPPLAVNSVSVPGHGTVSNNGNGTVTYTPAAGFFGSDTFTYTILDGQALTATGTVRVTVTPLCALINTDSFSDDFESGGPGWTVDTAINNIPVSPTWTPAPDPNAQNTTNHSFTSDSSGVDTKDDRLVSPPQRLSSTSHLIFSHRYQFEDGYDGGVLEVSTDGGVTWLDVLAGGGSFVSGGYNGNIDPSFGSPIAGRAAWTGGDATADMAMVEVNLGAFAGLDVRVRFRLTTDPAAAGSAPGVGWYIDDVQFTNTLVEGACPSVVSRKTHGSVDFDVPLPILNTAGIECRGTGSATNTYKLVYTLDRTPTAPGTATVSKGTATAGTPTLGPNANQVTVPLSGVTNAQHLVITLNGVQAASNVVLNNLVGRMDLLIGDTNADGSVNSSDIGQTKSQSFHPVGSSNFREDVNVDGAINSSDIGLVKNKSFTALPP